MLTCSDNPVAAAFSTDPCQLPSLLGGCDGQAAGGAVRGGAAAVALFQGVNITHPAKET